jgi:50S ribosomal subunit-associated GTPase HflX
VGGSSAGMCSDEVSLTAARTKMTSPFSRRTLLSPGKAREVADASRAAGAGAAVFLNPLTEHQRAVLGDLFNCLVMSNEDLLIHDR